MLQRHTLLQVTGSHRDAQVITWISDVWEELDPLLIASSFDKCGIISRNLADYSSQLPHFVYTNIFVHDVVPIRPN